MGAAAGASLLLLQASAIDPLVMLDVLASTKVRILLGILLAFLLSMALFHRRFPRIFEKAAMVLSTSLLVIVVLELASLGILSYSPGLAGGSWSGAPASLGQPGYAELDIGGGGNLIYAPFVGWHGRPESSPGTGVGADGNRLTPGTWSRYPFRVFVFGGSAMWGRGVPDSCTIASFLEAGLDSMPGRSVELTNFAQVGWTSTQSLVKLALELQSGDVPDLVIFYDGIADARAAYASGTAGLQQGLDTFGERIQGGPRVGAAPSVGDLARSTGICELIARVAGLPEAGPAEESASLPDRLPVGTDPDSLAEAVAQVYFSNVEAVDALARGFGFRCLFVWQPGIFSGNKTLTPGEVAVLQGIEPPLGDFYHRLWQRMWSRADSLPSFLYLGEEFQQVADPLYLDEGCLNAEGNGRVAQAIIRALIDSHALAGR